MAEAQDQVDQELLKKKRTMEHLGGHRLLYGAGVGAGAGAMTSGVGAIPGAIVGGIVGAVIAVGSLLTGGNKKGSGSSGSSGSSGGGGSSSSGGGGGCVADGTLITLANGEKVKVEDLNGDEKLLIWNMYTGDYDEANIAYIINHDGDRRINTIIFL